MFRAAKLIVNLYPKSVTPLIVAKAAGMVKVAPVLEVLIEVFEHGDIFVIIGRRNEQLKARSAQELGRLELAVAYDNLQFYGFKPTFGVLVSRDYSNLNRYDTQNAQVFTRLSAAC